MLGLNHRELITAIENRHSVRQYNDTPVDQGKLSELKTLIDDINTKNPGLSFRLVCDEPKAFGGRWASYGNFQGVKNYLVIAGEKSKTTDVKCGEKGEELVLWLQNSNLCSCWVGLTYKRIDGAFTIPEGHDIRCLIAFGYADATNGKGHKIKTLQQVSNCTDESPEWFREGVKMALLAPTAVNQQKFYFRLSNDGIVTASARFSLIGYSNIDLGIAITHFKIGSQNKYSNLEIK